MNMLAEALADRGVARGRIHALTGPDATRGRLESAAARVLDALAAPITS